MTGHNVRYQERIVKDPEILVGKPVIKGTRIPVELVLEHLANNPNLEELFADYLRLTLDDVKACLEYAACIVRQVQEKTPEQPAYADALRTAFVVVTNQGVRIRNT